MTLEFHEAANIFPLDEGHLDELADDIRERGQEEEIRLLDGLILDGRRRYLACLRAGVEPRCRAVRTDDPVAYVLSLNLYRRHLTPSQVSMVGGRAREWYDRKAKERQQEAAVKGNKSRAGKEAPVMANLPQPGAARDQAAKAVGVSGKSIDYATKVLKSGTPELARAVDEGRIAVSTAAILASEPEEVQRKEVNDPKRQRKYTSNGARPGAPEEEPTEEQRKRSKAIVLANEAISCLSRIPKNDCLRARGFQIVTDWIRRTLRGIDES